MKQQYRIYVIGPVPPDLEERIAAVHAAGILKEKSEVVPVHIKPTNSYYGGTTVAVRMRLSGCSARAAPLESFARK
jgi:hypothetical protein